MTFGEQPPSHVPAGVAKGACDCMQLLSAHFFSKCGGSVQTTSKGTLIEAQTLALSGDDSLATPRPCAAAAYDAALTTRRNAGGALSLRRSATFSSATQS
jgi:hypothetical protein